jgi:hypothetical protein
MIATTLKYFALSVFVTVAAGGSWFLHRQNQVLRRAIPDLSRDRTVRAQLRAENARLRELVAQAQRDHDGATVQIQQEAEELRAEVAEAERQAVSRRARMLEAVERDQQAMAANHDPRRGLMRVEFCRNLGQATPVDALQTLVWASLKDDQRTLAKVLSLSRDYRSGAEAIIARLPPPAQTEWSPERLGSLWVQLALTNLTAFQVVGETPADSTHTTLMVRFPGGGANKPVQFESDGNSWKLVLPKQALSGLEQKLRAQ